jgi:cytochrome c-type biogenesis protein CcmH/NrfG
MPSLREAVRLDPGLPEAHGTLGIALATLGETQAAVAALEEASRLDPEYMETRPASRLVYEAARRGEAWP